MDIQNTELRVEGYIRPQMVMEPIDTKIETLQRLTTTDHIDDFSLHGWPEKIALSERTPYSEALDAFKRMETWATEQGASIQPPFSVRTTTTTITNETRTLLRTPILCLAMYTGDQMAAVFPHSRGDEQYSVTDAISALRTDELELFPFTPDSEARPPDHCPECEALLTNVQGIGVCHVCDQIELGTTPRQTDNQRPNSPIKIAR